MYDAATRETYARLYKTAAKGILANLSAPLIDAMGEHPLIAAALVAAMGGTGGYLLGESQEQEKQEEKQKNVMQGLHYGYQLGKAP